MSKPILVKTIIGVGVVALVCISIVLWKYTDIQNLAQNIIFGQKIIQPETPSPEEKVTEATSTPKTFEYIKVTGGCDPYFEGTCLLVYSKPAMTSPVVAKLRNGIVLRVASTTIDSAGLIWYKIGFDNVRYPERITSDWYVPGDGVEVLFDVGDEEVPYGTIVQNNQHIVINLTEQMLYAYDGDTLFMQTPISTGFELTPTPIGTFSIYIKTPSRYMQGPQTGMEDYYDLPGVPWDMYFTNSGAAIHGAYWHNDFGKVHSHGCINLPPDQAEKLYQWAQLGTQITIEN